MKRKFLVKMMAVTMAGAIVLCGTGTAFANSLERTITLTKNTTITVNKETLKSSLSGKDAYITFETKVGSDDTVHVAVVNANNNIVSTAAASFRGTAKGTCLPIEYRSGKGKKGNYFRPRFTMDQSSQSGSIDVHYIFVP